MYGCSEKIQPPKGLRMAELQEAIPGADAVVTFGGDGTILCAARAASSHNVPVLGVNLGAKGFMAEMEREDVARIASVVLDEYDLDRRMMLDVELTRDGEPVYADFALNDVVVGGIARVVSITVFSDGSRISGFSGDGVVVATPTGSTAYSMSAGGPIVEPEAENIIITPICAHVLIAKSFVLAPHRRVTVRIGELGYKQAYLSTDGGETLPLRSGDSIDVRKSENIVCFIRARGKCFYEKISEKLGEKK
jgi:NAD+ kinase